MKNLSLNISLHPSPLHPSTFKYQNYGKPIFYSYITSPIFHGSMLEIVKTGDLPKLIKALSLGAKQPLAPLPVPKMKIWANQTMDLRGKPKHSSLPNYDKHL